MGKFRDIIKHTMAFKGLQQWPSAPAVWEPPYVEMVNGQKVLKSQRKWRRKDTDWWFGTFLIFPYIGNVIIPTDELIFLRGVGSTTNQDIMLMISFNVQGSWETPSRTCREPRVALKNTNLHLCSALVPVFNNPVPHCGPIETEACNLKVRFVCSNSNHQVVFLLGKF